MKAHLLRLPQNLQSTCHEIYTSRATKYSARHEICTSRSAVLRLPRNLHFEVHCACRRLPRSLRLIQVHKVLRLTKYALQCPQGTVPATKSASQDSHRTALQGDLQQKRCQNMPKRSFHSRLSPTSENEHCACPPPCLPRNLH